MPDTRHQRSRHAARLGETPRTNQKTATSEGEGRRIGKHLVRAGTQEHPTHEPLISRATLAEVPLAGLSFVSTWSSHGRDDRRGCTGGCNAGVQFRSKRVPNHHGVSGYQADIAPGITGGLYDESCRNLRITELPAPRP